MSSASRASRGRLPSSNLESRLFKKNNETNPDLPSREYVCRPCHAPPVPRLSRSLARRLVRRGAPCGGRVPGTARRGPQPAGGGPAQLGHAEAVACLQWGTRDDKGMLGQQLGSFRSERRETHVCWTSLLGQGPSPPATCISPRHRQSDFKKEETGARGGRSGPSPTAHQSLAGLAVELRSVQAAPA